MFDFGFGYSEMFVVAVVAIIVIGPKDLPKVLRALGKTVAKMRGMAREFQGHLDSAMKEAGLDVLTLPKTIDNDVAETDITFGFDTAVTTATDTDDLDGGIHHRVRSLCVEPGLDHQFRPIPGPEQAARGVLNPMDESNARQIRKMLRDKLL